MSSQSNALPSPVSHTVATIRNGDGTQWIFYYNVQFILSYEKITFDGKSTRSQLSVNGKPVVGGPNDSLAATLAADSPRVYYIDQDFILREVISETGDSWQSGALSNKNWAVYVNSGLDALGEGRLPSGVRLRVVFHEATKFPQWSAADYTDSNGWTTKLFPPAK